MSSLSPRRSGPSFPVPHNRQIRLSDPWSWCHHLELRRTAWEPTKSGSQAATSWSELVVFVRTSGRALGGL